MNLLKNFFKRVVTHKEIVIIAAIVMPIMIIAAVMLTTVVKKDTIAFYGDRIEMPKDSRISINKVKDVPSTGDLILGTYNYSVIQNKDQYKVTTLNNVKEKDAIGKLFKSGQLPNNFRSDGENFKKRGIGTNILGFIMMLVLMQGVAVGTLFAEDRENGTIKRILTSLVKLSDYLVVHNIFVFLAILIPSSITLFIIKTAINIEVGFSDLILFTLLFLMCLLGTAFAAFLNACVDRNANLIASGITIVTCVLSGCFIPFAENNKIMNTLLLVLPQRAYMELVENVTKGVYSTIFIEVGLVLVWIVFFWAISVSVVGGRLRKGRI
jgi:ABC-2 type transport system permease protein